MPDFPTPPGGGATAAQVWAYGTRGLTGDAANAIRDAILSDAIKIPGANVDAAISSRSSHAAAGVWHTIYSGAITADQFVEYPIGSTQSVTALRVRFYSTKASTGGCRIHEADFWEVVIPSKTTQYLAGLDCPAFPHAMDLESDKLPCPPPY